MSKVCNITGNNNHQDNEGPTDAITKPKNKPMALSCQFLWPDQRLSELPATSCSQKLQESPAVPPCQQSCSSFWW